MSMKIKKDDTIKILSGKDRGKKSKVIRVLPREFKIVAENVNLKKRHRRSRRQDRKGEVVLIPAPFSVSAVQLICPACGKPTRVRYRLEANGKKVRVCKRCGKTL